MLSKRVSQVEGSRGPDRTTYKMHDIFMTGRLIWPCRFQLGIWDFFYILHGEIITFLRMDIFFIVMDSLQNVLYDSLELHEYINHEHLNSCYYEGEQWNLMQYV